MKIIDMDEFLSFLKTQINENSEIYVSIEAFLYAHYMNVDER